MTKVDRIPAPQRVTFDPESHALTINIGATCLQLVRFPLIYLLKLRDPFKNINLF